MNCDAEMSGCASWRVMAMVVLCAGLVLSQWAHAQGSDLDALERRLQDLKKKQEEKKPAAPATEPRKPQVPAQKPRLATLVITADAPCNLRIDGVGKGRLAADQPATVEVAPGELLIQCNSTEQDGIKASQIKTVGAGAKAVVALELASKIAEQREAAARAKAEPERAQAEKKRPEKRAGRMIDLGNKGAGRMINLGNGMLQQASTGLQWTQRDNGSDIDWYGGRDYCSSLSLAVGGWRLPDSTELQGLVDLAGPTTACGTFACRVSSLFALTNYWFWTSETFDSSSAWYVHMDDGYLDGIGMDVPDNRRALCVRRP